MRKEVGDQLADDDLDVVLDVRNTLDEQSLAKGLKQSILKLSFQADDRPENHEERLFGLSIDLTERQHLWEVRNE